VRPSTRRSAGHPVDTPCTTSCASTTPAPQPFVECIADRLYDLEWAVFFSAPVQEDQVIPGGSRRGSISRRRRGNKWVERLQHFALFLAAIGILRWRSGLRDPREKRTLLCLLVSLFAAWTLRRLRSKSPSSPTNN